MSSAYNFAALHEALAQIPVQSLPLVAPVGLDPYALPLNQQLFSQTAFNINFQYWNILYQNWNWPVIPTLPVFQPPAPVMPQAWPAVVSNVLQSNLFTWPPPPAQQTSVNGIQSSSEIASHPSNNSFKIYRGKRHTYTNAELNHFLREYSKNRLPARAVYNLLEVQTGVPAHKIKRWFATRRLRDKKKEAAAKN